MPRGIQRKGIIRRNKIVRSAVKLFLENGYEKTTTANIAQAAGMAPSSFFAAFENKEALLLTLTKEMFESQFSRTEWLIGRDDPLLLYGVETAIQLYITELSEPLRETYVMAYSMATTSEYIYSGMAKKLLQLFGDYMPGAQEKDFYEMEIASGSIIRGFMAKHCDLYFTIDKKLKRFLSCCFTLYHVPQEKQDEVINAVIGMDLKPIAENIIADTVAKAEKGFEEIMMK